MHSSGLTRPPLIAALLLAAAVLACGDGEMGPSASTTGSVAGSVQDGAGPVAGVALALSRTGFSTMNATSGANGAFAFGSVEAGTWSLGFTPPAGHLAASGQVNPVAVTVQASMTTTVPAIQLQAVPGTGGIVATVTVNGAARAGVEVEVLEAGTQTVLQDGTTGGNGQVAFAGLDPGSYDVRVVPGLGHSLASGETETKAVTVSEGANAPVSFALTQPIVTINLTLSTFSPDTVQIQPGTIVRWVNEEVMFHTITPQNAGQPGVWQRREMGSQGEVFEHVFEVAAQTYRYRCEPHSSPFPNATGMVGVIVVQ